MARLLLWVLLLAATAAEAVTDTFIASGNWVAPAGVTSVTVEVWGGGGAGGGQNLASDGGGGGGGGAYSKSTVAVTPGNSYPVTVGAGGVGVASAVGGNGGDSFFNNAATVMAKGGTGGSPSTGTPPAGGLGGTAAASVGTTKFSGGNGGAGRNNNTGRGGPGGSSAGTAANGTSGAVTWATATAAAAPVGGGIGGNGGNANGQNGFAPASGNGGGGGGSAEGTARVGGNGAGGKVAVTYTLPPSVMSINCSASCTTNAASVSWTVTFSESVTGVSSGNFALVNSGLGGTPAITSVAGAGTTWTVTASAGTGTGTLGLNMVNTAGVSPALINLPLSGQVHSLDRTAPTVSSIARADATPTMLASVSWTVTFDEGVSGVDATDFALAQSGVSGALITAVTPVSATTYTVAASTGTGNGTLGLNLADNDSVIDGAGNPLGGAGAVNGDFSGEVYTVVRPRVYYMYFNAGTTLAQPNVTTNTTCPSPVDTTLTVSGIGLMADADDLTCIPAANRDVRWTAATQTLSMYYNGAGYTAAKDVTGISVGIRIRTNSATATVTARLFYTTSTNTQVYFSGAPATQPATSTRTEYTISLAGQSAASVPTGSKIGIEFSWSDPAGVRLGVNASINSEKLEVLEVDAATAPLDHLEIRHASGTGVTCTPSTLTIRACADTNCLTPYTAGVGGTLSATGTGMKVNWLGGAGFTIASGSSSVTKDVQVTTAGDVVFDAGSTPAASAALTCNFGTPACTFTAADAGFVVSASNHVAESASVLTVKAIRKSDSSQVCVPAFSGDKTVHLSCAYSEPLSGTLPVRIGGFSLNATNDAAAACDATGRDLLLNFDANGIATPVLKYADVGNMSVTVSHAGTIGSMDADLVMTGAGSFIAAPASFAFSAITAGKIKAGVAFGATVSALNSAGNITPNFGKEGEDVTLTTMLVTPDPVANPTAANPALGNSVIDSTEFGAGGMVTTDADGVASVNNLSWGEVGSIKLIATLAGANYLGSGLSATGTGATAVGPFIPHHFDTVVKYQPATRVFMPCPAGFVCPGSGDSSWSWTYADAAERTAAVGFVAADIGKIAWQADNNTYWKLIATTPIWQAFSWNGFVYSGQPFSVQVTAKNLAGGTTANYDGAFGLSKVVTLTAWDAAGSLVTENPGGGALAGSAVAAAAFGTGVAVAAPTYTFAVKETAPTNIFIRAADTDLVTSAAAAEGGVMAASGRVRLSNGHGSELLALPLAATVQYYNGNFWVPSITDTLMALNATDFALAFPAGTASKPNNLAACETVLSVGGVAPAFTINLSKPDSGNNGWTNLTLNLGAAAAGNHCADAVGGAATTANRPWLQFSVGTNPTARATFGVYRGNDQFIYMRENY